MDTVPRPVAPLAVRPARRTYSEGSLQQRSTQSAEAPARVCVQSLSSRCGAATSFVQPLQKAVTWETQALHSLGEGGDTKQSPGEVEQHDVADARQVNAAGGAVAGDQDGWLLPIHRRPHEGLQAQALQ